MINKPTRLINRSSTINVHGGTTVNNIINAGRINTFARPYTRYRGSWFHGSWHGWNAWPSFWGGYAVGTWRVLVLGSGGWYAPAVPRFVFYNPYFLPPPVPDVTIIESPAVTVQAVFDYSQPIAAPPRDEDSLEEDVEKSSAELIASAREAFRKGLYPMARRYLDKALKLVPGDTLAHEFRSLIFFAEGKYKDAAGVMYAVLAKGPGWDWDTMSAFYPPGDAYSRQLEALEAFCKENPKSADAHFLLGYHYLVLDEKDAAASAFAVAAELQPRDKLSASLAAALVAKPPEED